MHPLETLINEEFRKISQDSQYQVSYAITCTIHTPYQNIPMLGVTDFSLLRDYVNKFSDVLSITAFHGAGTIMHDIVPHYDKLEATVKLRPLANVPEYVENNANKIQEFRYKAIVYNLNMDVISGNNPLSINKRQADMESIESIRLQLVNPIQEQLRIKTFGGIVRNTNAMDFIRAILTRYSRIDSIDEKYKIEGVDVVPGYNTEIRDHIVIDHSTPITRLPMIVNEIVGGMYPTGFQYYLQQKHWYIWSPFDVKRYEKAPFKLTVINVPSNRLAQLEKTFRLTATQLIVLCTGDVSFVNISDRQTNNNSQGVRFVDASRVLDGFGEVKNNKFIVNRQQNINEFVSQDVKQENILIKESPDRITTNYLTQYSDIAFRKGQFLQFTWEYSADNLIFPGMPIRYIYMDGKKPMQVYGTVAGVESTYTPTIKTAVKDKRFANKTIVSCFVDTSVKSNEML